MQPPQNPYGTPNPYESGNSPIPSRGVSMDVIGEAWNILKPNIGPWIGAFVLMYVIVGVFGGLMFTGFRVDPVSGAPSFGFLFYVFFLLYIVAAIVMSVGLMKLSISTVRTGRTEIGEMFNVTDVVGNVIIASLLFGIIYSVGLVLCVIPGIIAALGLSMSNFLVVDQKMSPIDALKTSWDKSKDHLGGLFVLFLVLGVINFIGSLLCGIGVLVTAPLTQIALVLVYRDLFLGGKMGGGPSSGYSGPTAPIASPR